MRATVDEKLQATLEARLGESFKLVSERLEAVHKGLGEMQSLANGVGDLKRVLTNVKTRGTWGEVQLGNLLEQILTPDQYAANVAVNPESAERVDFAVKLPGHGTTGAPPCGCRSTPSSRRRITSGWWSRPTPSIGRPVVGRPGGAGVRRGPVKVREKYVVAPAHDRLRRPVPADRGAVRRGAPPAGPVRRHPAGPPRRPGRPDHAGGPAIVSLQMGFRTLAMEKRSTEVWQVLGARCATEFGKFGDVLSKVQKKLAGGDATPSDQAAVRSRAVERTLRAVDRMPGDAASCRRCCRSTTPTETRSRQAKSHVATLMEISRP